MLYVLDIDDTLYLERDYVRSGFCAVGRWFAENRNIEDFFEHAWTLFESGARGNIFDTVLEDLGVFDKELVTHLVHLYRSHHPNISFQADAMEFLRRHNRDDFAIITDGYSNAQWAKIRALNLEQYMDKIIVTDDWGKEFWKPNPKAYILAQGRRSPKECVYIADNPLKDFEAPAKLGWAPSVRIRRKESLHYAIDTPDLCIEVDLLTDGKL
jgi:putative hydrolase of the HAD superfamily